jgi:hypothetical protein
VARRHRRSRVVTFALVILAGASAITTLAAQSSASTLSDAPVPVPPGNSSTIVASATWGISDGQAFSRVTKDVEIASASTKSASIGSNESPAASGSCTEDISDVTRSGSFYWSTSQICSGQFGAQSLITQMLRSSWSGYRGYGAQSDLPAKGNASQTMPSCKVTPPASVRDRKSKVITR